MTGATDTELELETVGETTSVVSLGLTRRVELEAIETAGITFVATAVIVTLEEAATWAEA